MLSNQITTKVQGRQTGKTSEVIRMMERDPKSLLIVPHYMTKKDAYPNKLQYRIFTIKGFLEGKFAGIDFDNIIIDEGFLIDKEDLAKLYYSIGYAQYPVFVIGSM